jgi:hypothetical protein
LKSVYAPKLKYLWNALPQIYEIIIQQMSRTDEPGTLNFIFLTYIKQKPAIKPELCQNVCNRIKGIGFEENRAL